MFNLVLIGDLSTGHGGFPGTQCIGGTSSSTFINGQAVALDGAQYQPHTDGSTTHTPRIAAASGVGTLFIEGKLALKQGDPISCGDTVGAGTGLATFY